MNASDASVYLGMAAHIARTGALEAEDPLVAEMTPQERQTLFKNRFPKDVTGPYARFPGGVRLLDPSRASVSFHFYHLWPVWLALGVTTIGSAGSIGLLSLFAAVSLISLFLLGHLLVGRGFALTLVVLLFSCFPQLYYSRLPLSEVPAQAFFLAGLLCFLRAINARGVQRHHLQLLAAALWGCLCLLRVDGVLFLLPALTCSFLFWIELRRSVLEWLPFGIALMLFLALALIHQFAGGTYETPSSGLPLIGDVTSGLAPLARGIRTRHYSHVGGCRAGTCRAGRSAAHSEVSKGARDRRRWTGALDHGSVVCRLCLAGPSERNSSSLELADALPAWVDDAGHCRWDRNIGHQHGP